ncbi:MAG: hypothetical protein KF866_02285 [Phycisphaeraceae bacterium]|nr:hypothetical protein [Phycisphaeraceae bacterium]MCW5753478.1 hypothetical protein [Phycisphaeraceae bacterium]
MSMQALHLLRALGSGVLPQGVPARKPAAGTPEFEQLLEQARKGHGRTGAGVDIDPGLGLSLDEAQMQRLAEAADRATAAGAKTAVVHLDGMLLTLDVASRRVVGQVRPHLGDVLTGVDAFVEAGKADQAA